MITKNYLYLWRNLNPKESVLSMENDKLTLDLQYSQYSLFLKYLNLDLILFTNNHWLI